jgi:hypothetical protein
MAHFAELDENNVVLRVLVIEQSEINTGNWGNPENWKQCSYNTINGIYYTPSGPDTQSVVHPDQSKAFRKNYPGIGAVYDVSRDAFINPKKYPSWVLDEFKCDWVPPIPRPEEDGFIYEWDEATVSWKVIGRLPTQYGHQMETTVL